MSIERLDINGVKRIFEKIKSIIPTKTSDLDNDSGFVTSQYPVEILNEEQTEANTTPDKYVSDAMVTRELLLRQNGVRWILDEDTGAIKGYKTKAGADTEFPFSSGELKIVPVLSFARLIGGSITIDVASKIDKYSELTANNFAISELNISGTGAYTGYSANRFSYNQSTGELTITFGGNASTIEIAVNAFYV